ncbi:unnamed protein product [Effrenium voratum]|uniref:ShKT domain-containing protein n=1 Tax=Effrenium voratum TaxID=2562239 RepID=A0AA36HMH1_9DINO|nr:unnamed protein product [Effrenium voratum]
MALAAALTLLLGAVSGEEVARGGGFQISKQSYTVPKQPRDDLKRNRGPVDRGTTYGRNEVFHVLKNPDGREGLMWQEYGNNLVGKPIFITWLSSGFSSAENVQLTPDDHNPWLAGATSDGSGKVLYFEVQDVTQWLSNELMAGWTIGKTETSKAWMVEYDPVARKETRRAELNTDMMSLHDFAENTANVCYDPVKNQLGVSLSHLMTRSMDGLNHQVGTAFVFDLDKFEINGMGSKWVGSHSFQQGMVADVRGGFLGVGTFDASPRGIQVMRLQYNSMDTFQVYAVKTRHGAGPTNPAGTSFPVFEEISSPGKTFYKWSNDNQVYTEMAQPGLVEVEDGFLVFFAGEAPALDSSKMVPSEESVQSPRNMGWVKIGKNIGAKQVLSDGPVEKGGFYGFRGEWQQQEHRGINWLTDFKEKWLVMAKPKSVRLGANRILLMWEQWHHRDWTEKDCEERAAPDAVSSCKSIVSSGSGDVSLETFVRSEFMVVDDNVSVVRPLWSMEGGIITPQGDAPQVHDGCAVIYTGRTLSIERWTICADSCEPKLGTIAKPTDDPCFEPYPAAPFKCMDGVDAGGGKGYGPTTCPSGEECRKALCYEVPHFCDSTRQYCPKTCGVCSEADDEEVTPEYKAKVDFLNSCHLGSRTFGLPPPAAACVDSGMAPFMMGGRQLSCEEAKAECNRPTVTEDGKADDTAERMAATCAKTCGACGTTTTPPSTTAPVYECTDGTMSNGEPGPANDGSSGSSGPSTTDDGWGSGFMINLAAPAKLTGMWALLFAVALF